MSMGLNLGKKQVGRVLGGAERTLPGNYGHAAMLASTPDQILYKPVFYVEANMDNQLE